VLAFAPQGQISSRMPSVSVFANHVNEETDLVAVLSEKRGFPRSALAGIVTGLSNFVARGMAADDLEIAELPPPYIPALFGV
jgi:hypothetical protein